MQGRSEDAKEVRGMLRSTRARDSFATPASNGLRNSNSAGRNSLSGRRPRGPQHVVWLTRNLLPRVC